MSIANRLYFRLDRIIGKSATGVQTRVLCKLGKHKTDTVYNAVGFAIDKSKHMAITVFTSCIDHVPEGSWVEGRDKPTREADPIGDRQAGYIARKYRLN